MFSNQEKTEIYKKYLPLMNKQSYYFSLRSNNEQEELFGELQICFCQKIDKWNSEKGTIGTYLKKCYRNHLVNYCISHQIKNPKDIIIDFDVDLLSQNEEKQSYYLDLFEEHEDKVLREIAYAVKEIEKAIKTGLISEKRKKQNWLDKFINITTGISYKEIWKGFKLAETIIQGV